MVSLIQAEVEVLEVLTPLEAVEAEAAVVALCLIHSL
jgi:hypothetical protein